jgi:hypothetical protein
MMNELFTTPNSGNLKPMEIAIDYPLYINDNRAETPAFSINPHLRDKI